MSEEPNLLLVYPAWLKRGYIFVTILSIIVVAIMISLIIFISALFGISKESDYTIITMIIITIIILSINVKAIIDHNKISRYISPLLLLASCYYFLELSVLNDYQVTKQLGGIFTLSDVFRLPYIPVYLICIFFLYLGVRIFKSKEYDI